MVGVTGDLNFVFISFAFFFFFASQYVCDFYAKIFILLSK